VTEDARERVRRMSAVEVRNGRKLLPLEKRFVRTRRSPFLPRKIKRCEVVVHREGLSWKPTAAVIEPGNIEVIQAV
jgi:hypothetical protein